MLKKTGLILLLLCLPMQPARAGTDALSYEDQTLTLEGERVTVRVPQGYRMELLSRLDSPRMLAFAANGDLFTGSESGKVYRLPPPYTKPQVLVQLPGYPHSVAFRQNEILIARTNGLYRAPYQAGQASIAASSVVLLAALPAGGGHSSRTVRVGPDGKIYLSLGIQSNCSDEYLGKGYPFESQRGGVMVLREDGGKAQWEPYASGLRNPVGFDWQPGTSALYASNNGPDHHGFDQPPEYFSRLTPGSFHGMPWFQFDGKEFRRDNCVSSSPPRPVGEAVPPVATFSARSAPMGVAFVPPGGLSAQLADDAVVALHGSWGTQPSGDSSGDAATRRPPKLVAVRFESGQARRVDDLITGFQLPDGKRWARPVGVVIGPDNALYFSSDSGIAGLYRLKRMRN
ncbi:MAG: PQQ-dependent sugar dehydrogenase [Pseudomonadota bacterium]